MKKINCIRLISLFLLFFILNSCKKTQFEEQFNSEINSSNTNRPASVCPTLNQPAGPDKIICPTPGSVQIGLPQVAGFSYSWSPITGLSDPNVSNPIATPTATTTYTLTTTYYNTNLIRNGNFELGNVGFLSNYIYTTSPLSPNYYSIVSNLNAANTLNCSAVNHTIGGNKLMAVDGGTVIFGPGAYSIFWSKDIVGLSTNSTYYFSFWVYSANLNNKYHTFNNPSNNFNAIPQIEVTINGNILSATPLPFTNCSGWFKVEIPFSTGFLTNANISMTTSSIAELGNDFGIDDIALTQCSDPVQNFPDEVTVSVYNTCPQPAITTASYFKFGACMNGTSMPPEINPSNQPIIPNNYNEVCTFSDCGGLIHLFSNLPNNNQWFVNDIPVFGATNQEFVYNGGAGLKKIQVKNTTFNSTILSTATYVTIWNQYIYPFNTTNIGYFKPNTTKSYGVGGPNSPPGTIFTWSVPGCTVTNLSTNGNQVRIFFPSSIGTNTINGTITVSNSNCLNGTMPINFIYGP